MCLIVILLLLIDNTVRALAVSFWPLSVFWRSLVFDNYSITGFVANLSTITDSSYIFLQGENIFRLRCSCSTPALLFEARWN